VSVLFGVRGRFLAAVVLSFCLGMVVAGPVAGQVAPQMTISQKIAASNGLLDINAATAAQLKALPGMGDAYVRRVIAGRPYSAKNQLTTRGILPAAEYEEIKALIIAHRVKK
jgi:competence protein ComEA